MAGQGGDAATTVSEMATQRNMGLSEDFPWLTNMHKQSSQGRCEGSDRLAGVSMIVSGSRLNGGGCEPGASSGMRAPWGQPSFNKSQSVNTGRSLWTTHAPKCCASVSDAADGSIPRGSERQPSAGAPASLALARTGRAAYRPSDRVPRPAPHRPSQALRVCAATARPSARAILGV